MLQAQHPSETLVFRAPLELIYVNDIKAKAEEIWVVQMIYARKHSRDDIWTEFRIKRFPRLRNISRSATSAIIFYLVNFKLWNFFSFNDGFRHFSTTKTRYDRTVRNRIFGVEYGWIWTGALIAIYRSIESGHIHHTRIIHLFFNPVQVSTRPNCANHSWAWSVVFQNASRKVAGPRAIIPFIAPPSSCSLSSHSAKVTVFSATVFHNPASTSVIRFLEDSSTTPVFRPAGHIGYSDF